MNGWSWYGTKDLQVIPYMNGTPVYVDGMLPTLYERTKQEGKLERVFCGDELNLDGFVSFFHTRKTMQVLCEIAENKTIKPVGYSWVDLPKGVDGARSAHCGFCFFDDSSKRSSARYLGRLGIAYWMIDLKINVLHGIMLESNTAARNYAKRLGFRTVAMVPRYHYSLSEKELVGARVVVLEDIDFLPFFSKWRDKFPVANQE